MSEELPHGWCRVRLGDLGDWGSGGTPKTTVSAYYGGEIPWAKSGDLNDGLLTEAEETISHAGLENSSAKLVEPGTLLVAMYGATIGILSVSGIRCATNQAVAHLAPYRDVADVWFLFWLLRAAREELRSLGQGGAQPNISQTILKNYPVNLPPLAEQRRIVARIEALFARIRQVRADLMRITRLADRFVSAGLHTQIDQTAGGEVKRIALSRVVLPGAPIIYGILQPGPDTAGGVPYVRPTEIDRYEIQLHSLRRTTPAIAERYRRSALAPGDVLLSIVGTIGKVAIVPEGLDGGNITQSSCRLRPNPDRVRSKFLALSLRTPAFVNQINDRRLGTAVPRLNLEDVREMTIPDVELQEQDTAVERVERHLRLAQTVSQESVRTLALLEYLERCILTRAFRGELVLQDPTEEPVTLPTAAGRQANRRRSRKAA